MVLLMGEIMPHSRILTFLLLAAVGLPGQDRLPPGKLFPEWPEVWSSFDTHPKDCHLGLRDRRGRLITVGVETRGDPRTMAARQQITMLVNERGLWTDPIEISRPGVVYFPALTVASDGSVWVAWSEFDGAEWHIRLRSWLDGELGPAHRVSYGEVNVQPTLVAARRGIAVAWQAAKDGRFEIQGSVYRDGKWTEPRTISRAGEHEFRPKAAVDANGGIWLAWDRFDKGRYQVFARRLWEEPVAVFAGDRDTMYPQLVADGAGRVWVLASGRLAALDASGQRFELEAPLPEWQGGPDFMNVDSDGRLWLFKGLGSRADFDWMRGYRNAETMMAVVDSRGLHALKTFDTYLGYAAPQIDADGVVWAMNRVQFLRYSPPAGGLGGPPQVKSAPLSNVAFTPEPRREWPRYNLEINRHNNSVWFAEMHNHLRELPRETQIASWVDRFYLTSRYRTGLDAAAITDHDWPGMTRTMYFVEQAVAKVLDSEGEFLAFTGYEWSGDSQVRGRFGDRTVLFPNGYHDIPRISDDSANDAAKLSRQIARLGALDWPHHIGRQESPVPPESLNRATEPVMEMTSGHGVFETYNPADAVPCSLPHSDRTGHFRPGRAGVRQAGRHGRLERFP